MRGFLADIYLRPSCYACPAKSGKSGSDITIADAWGINEFAQEFDDDKGACYVLENTNIGSIFLHQLSVERSFVDLGIVKKCNPSYISSVNQHYKRFLFFRQYVSKTKGRKIEEIVSSVLKSTFVDKLLWSIRRRIALINRCLHR